MRETSELASLGVGACKEHPGGWCIVYEFASKAVKVLDRPDRCCWPTKAEARQAMDRFVYDCVPPDERMRVTHGPSANVAQ